MFKIVKREQFSPITFLWEVEDPDMAKVAQPGHFVMVKISEKGERIPLTIADIDREKGTITIVVQVVGKSTQEMRDNFNEGDTFPDFIGPLGLASDIQKKDKVVLVGGGLGIAPVFPQLKKFKEAGSYTISIVGFRNKDLVFWEDKFKEYSDELYVTTDDGSYGDKGFVTTKLQQLLDDPKNKDISEIVAIGPLPMMKASCDVTRPYNVKTMVSLNSIMVDGTGMCGSCRVTYDGALKFACVDGPDFDGHKVDFAELMHRQLRFQNEEKDSISQYEEECKLKEAKAGVRRTVKTIAEKRVKMPEQEPKERVKNFAEVALGFTKEMAIAEAERCLDCKKPLCINGCPVGIDIPGFLREVENKNFKKSLDILKKYNALPAVCGRVCPQENQCEKYCIVGKKKEPVAIGRVERFVADYAMQHDLEELPEIVPNGHKVAIVGAGPGGLACAGELALNGYDVTIYEALHVAGGVLKYGIPEFRLPNDIIDKEIKTLKMLGVKIELNRVIGKIFTIDQLMKDMGYESVFIASGAGFPSFMGIEGEGLNGVMSANEFLTRVNLMVGSDHPNYDTPVGMGKKVAVIGAGNTAMDACRVALRLGAQEVQCVYRRSEKESPARLEELHHAQEEGVNFNWLTNPVKINGSPDKWVTGMECIKMELGEPDASGRRRPIPVEGSNFVVDCDTVVYALGTNANPIISTNTPGLETNKWGNIVINEETGMTSIPGVFAGGDIVTGAATVIEAMGAGKIAANGIMNFIASK